MKRLVMFAVAALAMATLANDSQVNAQEYSNAYRFGVGLNIGQQQFPFPNQGVRGRQFGRGFFGGGTIGVLRRAENQPFFAMNPPVYYSGIVRRPYGVSPFAAPPGIVPVEMQMPPAPATIQNPYFDQNQAPMIQPEAVDSEDNKTTMMINPYIGRLSAN